MVPFDVGVRLPTTGPAATQVGVARVAAEAQSLGFASLWASEHIVLADVISSSYPGAADGIWRLPSSHAWLDPFTALTWAAAHAPQLRVGTAIVVLPLRHPLLVAKQAATLAVLTGGRFVLGLGAGWMREEFELLGAPYEERGRRAAEGVSLLREAWATGAIHHAGVHYDVRGADVAPSPPGGHIPILWGGHATATLRRIAVLGDGWVPIHRTPDELARGLTELRRVCVEEGRDPSTLRIVAKPGVGLRLDEESAGAFGQLAIDEVVIDPPYDPVESDRWREELERVSEVCGLARRL